MKKKYWFFSRIFFSLIPLSVFAAYGGSYDIIVRCDINTIPKFIKAVIDLAVKVGIPVASIFLIFAGFQFLTAQGDEGKLRKAKSGLLWSSVGFGVLLGAWLFATAILGTITAIMGGSAEDLTNTSCSNENTSPTGNFFWPDPVPLKQTELSEVEKATSVSQSSVEECAAFYDVLLSGSDFDTTIPQGGLTPSYVPADNQTVECNYDDGVSAIQKNMSQLPEQMFLYVTYKNGPSQWMLTAVGKNGSVPAPKALLEALSKTSVVKEVYQMHTHPYQKDTNMNTDYSAPSLTDIILAYRDALTRPISIFTEKVIDTKIVWQYVVDHPYVILKANKDIQDATIKAISNTPETDAAWWKEYNKTSNHGKILIDKNDLTNYSKATCTILMRECNGDFGTEAKTDAQSLQVVLNNSPLMKYDKNGRYIIGNGMGDYQTYMGNVLNAANDMGVSLSAEMHPYAWCKK